MTEHFIARIICGSKAKVSIWVVRSSLRKIPRWPPASNPARSRRWLTAAWSPQSLSESINSLAFVARYTRAIYALWQAW